MLRELEALGFNGFRLPMMWAAVQPTEDMKPDMAYLEKMMQVTTTMQKYNMYGLLDMHKDTVGHPGAYDGYPRWLTNRTKVKHQYPWPLKQIKAWGDSYFTEQDATVIQDVYDNTHGGMDALANFWETVASYYKLQQNILGYELMNEPWAGNELANPLLMLPGYAGKKNLEPMHNTLAKAIRGVDKETMLLFEPVTWGMFISGKGIQGSGFESPPDPNSAFAWHYYCFLTGPDVDNYTTLNKVACDKAMGPQVFNAVSKERKRLRVPSLLTEWGGKHPNVSLPLSTSTVELEVNMNLADERFEGWTFYDMVSIVSRSGELDYDAMKVMSRPFAQAIAGIPTSMSFNTAAPTACVDCSWLKCGVVSSKNPPPCANQCGPGSTYISYTHNGCSADHYKCQCQQTTGVFKLDYMVDPAIDAPTEIVVPSIRFPHGFTVELSDGLSWKMAENRTGIVAIASSLKSKSAVTVSILPKASDAMVLV
jgi:endoglycosylceramidase